MSKRAFSWSSRADVKNNRCVYMEDGGSVFTARPQDRPALIGEEFGWLCFFEREGKPNLQMYVGLANEGLCQKSREWKDLSAHTLRAACATHCLQGKKRREQMHPRHLMELLGHSSMESLNPYLSVSIVDLKEAHSRCHPRNVMKNV
jgi:site-specific recombinase XerD